MRARIVIVNLDNANWFIDAINTSRKICSEPFIPSPESLELFDEKESMKMVCRNFYGEKFDV